MKDKFRGFLNVKIMVKKKAVSGMKQPLRKK